MTAVEPVGREAVIFPGYDDMTHKHACGRAFPDASDCRDLVDQLAALDVTYLTGGSPDWGRASPYAGPADVDVPALMARLANAPDARVRDALVGLLLRHPEHAASATAVIASASIERSTRASLAARLLAAAALQRAHQPAFTTWLPAYPLIDVAAFTARENLPDAAVDSGHALLRALQARVASRYPAIDYVDGWHDVARHILQELQWAAKPPAGS